MVKKSRQKVRLGLVQVDMGPSFADNLKQVQRLLNRALQQRPDFIVLPEMALGVPPSQKACALWASFYQQALDQLQDWSKDHGIGIFLSYLEADQGRTYNTAVLIQSNGRRSSLYRKIHLFKLDNEHKIYAAGSQPCVISTAMGKTGLAICYDIRFPELMRVLTDKGMQVLVVMAQWPAARLEHWLSLLKARAIENQVYVVGVNRLGAKGRLLFRGGSVVFDPWGECVVRMGARSKIAVVEIDLKRVSWVRSRYPFLRDRVLG